MERIKQVFGWLVSIVFFVGFIALTTQSIAWLFFLGISIMFCPPVIKLLEKFHKKPKLWIRIIAAFCLMILAGIFIPASVDGDTVNNITPPPVMTEEKSDIASDVKTEDKTRNSENQGISSNGQDAVDLQTPANENTNLSIHFIDVGQGDAIFIESDGHSMLIDAGENDKGTTVVNYLKDQGVEKLDIIIGTHPHSDHIGGMDTVINSFDIGKVILPDALHSTQTFEDLLDIIAEKRLEVKQAVVGDIYRIGSASFTIISPNGSDYNDLNDFSIGIKLTNGSNTFLMTGDAEAASEQEMINNGIDLSADVLKLGHHGSSYSSQSSFLDKVNPSYAIISTGEGNSYGHPHQETLQRIYDRKIQLYRTDKQGTIIFYSDGKIITTNVQAYPITSKDLENPVALPTTKPTSDPKPTSVPTAEPTSVPDPDRGSSDKDNSDISAIKVYITKSGDKYHRAGCRYLKSISTEVTLSKALSKGLKPCKVCHPPTK